MTHYTYQNLRQMRLDKATKPFNARGARLIRCERCLLASSFCICQQIVPVTSRVDWIVLMHPDEVLKPTNTGRLVADIFPSNTWVFEWARTQAPEGILPLLADSSRFLVVVFPAQDGMLPEEVPAQAELEHLRLTLILLDGTWKQARKMFNRTPWLASLPAVGLPLHSAQYGLRKAAHAGNLSTAEAAIGLLECFEPAAALPLHELFCRFNQGYLLSRGLRNSS